MYTAVQFRAHAGEFVFHADSQNMIKHVFDGVDPVEKDGKDLTPAVLLARALVSKLEQTHQVSCTWTPRDRNRAANSPSRAALRYRLGRPLAMDDQWDGLSESFKQVFHLVGQNRMRTAARCIYLCPDHVLAFVRSL